MSSPQLYVNKPEQLDTRNEPVVSFVVEAHAVLLVHHPQNLECSAQHGLQVAAIVSLRIQAGEPASVGVRLQQLAPLYRVVQVHSGELSWKTLTSDYTLKIFSQICNKNTCYKGEFKKHK